MIALSCVAVLLAGAVAPAARAQALAKPQRLTTAGYLALTESTALATHSEASFARAAETPSLADDRRVANRFLRECRRIGDKATPEVVLQRDICEAGGRAARSMVLGGGRCVSLDEARFLTCLAGALRAFGVHQASAVELTRRFADRLAPSGCRALFLDSATVGQGLLDASRRLAAGARARDEFELLEGLDWFVREGQRSTRFAGRIARRQSACAPPGR